MKANISVSTGEVWATGRTIVINSEGLVSCGVIVPYDAKKRIGGLAHIMLPGHPRKSRVWSDTKYAADAIDDLLFKMTRLGTIKEDIEACLVGGANVLCDENDTICERVISSITELLDKNGIAILVKAVGGTKRRGVSLDIEDGRVYYFEGNSNLKLLYSWRKNFNEQ